MLLEATARGADGRDTSGWFVLDTGAGYLVLDASLAVRLGAADSGSTGPIGVAARPLTRFSLAGLDMDQVGPVLTFNGDIIRRVADRPVLGLVGQRLLRDRALWIDYESSRIALVPAGPGGTLEAAAAVDSSRRLLRGLLSSDAVPVPFRMSDDGKVLVKARITGPREKSPTAWLTFALDTGASKCVLFENTADSLTGAKTWQPSLHGLVAPTLIGEVRARLVQATRMEVKEASAMAVDVAILNSPLAADLSRVAGEAVHGLLGYSFLRQFMLACDYPHRVLWLDPIPDFRNDRPFEHSHVGLQVERNGGRARVVAVVKGSPAERAGIRAGDEIVGVDGTSSGAVGIFELTRLMEGRPGTSIAITIRSSGVETTHRLRRRRLL